MTQGQRCICATAAAATCCRATAVFCTATAAAPWGTLAPAPPCGKRMQVAPRASEPDISMHASSCSKPTVQQCSSKPHLDLQLGVAEAAGQRGHNGRQLRRQLCRRDLGEQRQHPQRARLDLFSGEAKSLDRRKHAAVMLTRLAKHVTRMMAMVEYTWTLSICKLIGAA
jgi:hypothetical protein